MTDGRLEERSRRPMRLKEAMRQARIELAARSGGVVDLQETQSIAVVNPHWIGVERKHQVVMTLAGAQRILLFKEVAIQAGDDFAPDPRFHGDERI